MQSELIKVHPHSVVPTSGGCAVFMQSDEENSSKTFIIYVDHAVGSAISASIKNAKFSRPMTHDLMVNILSSQEIILRRAVIHDYKNQVYSANLTLEKIQNEGKKKTRKIIEIDTRPSDAIALCLRAGTSIFIKQEILENLDDMSAVMQILEKKQRDNEA